MGQTLAMEPLAKVIIQDPAIMSINVHGTQYKISLYADDTLLYILELVTSIHCLIGIITLFGLFFGYKICFCKSIAMPTGSFMYGSNHGFYFTGLC